MTRRLVFIVMVLAVVGGVSRLLFNGRRVNQLSRQLLADATKFRAAPNACLDGHVATLSLDDAMACAAQEGGLPDGLEAGTAGPVDWRAGDTWLRQAEVELATGEQPAQRCLDALRFSALLARHGGAEGERVGSRLALLALQPCLSARPSPAQLSELKHDRAQLRLQLSAVMTGLVLDGQLRRLGSWMNALDRQALPTGMKALADASPPPPVSPFERNARLGIWARAQHVGQQLVALDALPEAAADALIATCESEWPERVSDPKRVRAAYEEERLRANAAALLYDAWLLGPGCSLDEGATSTVRPDGADCLLTNGKLHVQLPSRRE